LNVGVEVVSEVETLVQGLTGRTKARELVTKDDAWSSPTGGSSVEVAVRGNEFFDSCKKSVKLDLWVILSKIPCEHIRYCIDQNGVECLPKAIGYVVRQCIGHSLHYLLPFQIQLEVVGKCPKSLLKRDEPRDWSDRDRRTPWLQTTTLFDVSK
jgi:hypothetical protein